MSTSDLILSIQQHVESYKEPRTAPKRGFWKKHWGVILGGAGVLSLLGFAFFPSGSLGNTVASIVFALSWISLAIKTTWSSHLWAQSHLRDNEKEFKKVLLGAIQKHPELKECFGAVLPLLFNDDNNNLAWKEDLFVLLSRLRAQDTPTHAHLDAQIEDLVFGNREQQHREFNEDIAIVDQNKITLKNSQQNHWRI